MEPLNPSFTDEFNVLQEYAVLVFDVRRAAVSFPFQVHRLKMLVEAGLAASSGACFEFAGEVPDEAQHGSLANLLEIFLQPSSRPFESCCCGILRVDATSLLPLLSCQIHLNLHTGPQAPTLCSTRALRARCQFGSSEKYDVGHIGGDVTDSGTIGDWW